MKKKKNLSKWHQIRLKAVVSVLTWGARGIGPTLIQGVWESYRAVIKSRGPGISPGYYECGPRLRLLENRRKSEPKETPRCLIPRLLVVFTRQLEILTTTLKLSTV